jgi:toxin ParE1/3/4
VKPLSVSLGEAAIQDLKDYATHIEMNNPDAADRFTQAAARTFEILALAPLIGAPRYFRRRKLHGLRSWRISGFENYLVFYRAEKDRVDIVRVIHGAMDLDKELE